MRIVVDTTVIVAVVTNEPHKQRLIELTNGAERIAPPSQQWEIGNAFSAMLKRARISLEQVREAVRQYRTIPVTTVSVAIEPALELSAALQIYAYDSYMILCAKEQNCPLLTLDSGLKYAAAQAKVDVLEVEP